jgi:hypothetical protein
MATASSASIPPHTQRPAWESAFVEVFRPLLYFLVGMGVMAFFSTVLVASTVEPRVFSFPVIWCLRVLPLLPLWLGIYLWGSMLAARNRPVRFIVDDRHEQIKPIHKLDLEELEKLAESVRTNRR